MDQMYAELIEHVKKEGVTREDLASLRHRFAKKYGVKTVPSNIQILLHADERDVPALKKKLMTKPVRTISGVSVVALMSKPWPCPHGKCTMCPDYIKQGAPMSYTGKEPSTLRAIRNNYDSYLITMNRLEHYVVGGHNFDKIEVIVQGGTFPFFPFTYQKEFLLGMYKALNDFFRMFFVDGEFDLVKFKEFFELPGDIKDSARTKRVQDKFLALKKLDSTSLEEEKEYNDLHSFVKCVGVTIETRADYGKEKHGNQMLELGCTRVEIGVQSVYDDVLERIHRGHSVQDNIESIRILKDMGYKLNFHMMPGLPGVDFERDLKGLKEIFKNSDYKPDMLKIYPCMVFEGTDLFKDFKDGTFVPINASDAGRMIAEFKKDIPEYCRIMRIQRDIPSFMVSGGVDKTNLRQYISDYMKKKGWVCRCIRCREIGRNPSDKKGYDIKVMQYEASHGKEFFISAEVDDAILGFVRLRFPSQYGLREEITPGSALLRELHVYGRAVQIGEEGVVQHKGIGKKLMKKAEEIAKEQGFSKMVVISGVGVRGYYCDKLGYSREGAYVVKGI